MLERTVICPYCNKPAKLVTGEVIYPRTSHLHKEFFWLCAPCCVYVGTHRNSQDSKPQAHAWLRKQLNLTKEACHIEMFDVEKCKAVIDICNNKEF